MTSDIVDRVVADVEAGEGAGFRVESVRPVSGGDINEAAVLGTSEGRLFLKWNRRAPAGMFEAEADGLAALGAAAGEDLFVPEVLGLGEVEGAHWLLMEFVDGGSGGRTDESWPERLGRGLAGLHRASAPDGMASDGESAGASAAEFGWHRDNFIGRLPQTNAPTDDWAEFWRDRRIRPQVRQAADSGLLTGEDLATMDALVERIDEALAGAAHEGPSLLHGDLWGGNAMAGPGGRAAIYDPAVYRGHREVDLAMTELFGFPSGFMPAYREAWPVEELYDVRRRDLYQLYYLLVHVNLFGRGYVASAVAAASRVLATL